MICSTALRSFLRLGFPIFFSSVLLPSCRPPERSEVPFAPEEWSLEGPTVRIGSVEDPDYSFRLVLDLAMSPTGILHSLHRQEAGIRRWDKEGRPAGVVGREGEGPGEFRQPGEMGFFGDSLWVVDRQLHRVSFFDLDGSFLGLVPFRADMSPDPENPHKAAPRPTRPLRDGTLYGMGFAPSDAVARGQISEVEHVRMDSDGDILGIVWIQPYRPTDVLALLRDGGGGGSFGPQPFGDRPLFTVSDEDVLWVLERRAYEGDGTASVRFSEIDMTGDTLLSRQIEYTPERLPGEKVDSASRAQAEGMFGFMQRFDPEISLAKLEADLRKATYAPDYMPAIREMVVADDGSIWLQRFSPTEEGTVWWVLGEDGEPLATTVIPEGLRVLLITGDAVWGVETDEYDVNYIVRYEIVRGGS